MSRYGWVRDRHDDRDLLLAPPPFGTKLPLHVDLRPVMPPVYDQGELGSCTGNAWAAALQVCQVVQKRVQVFRPSRLFIYYYERVVEGTVSEDSGAQIRDGAKVVARYGAPPEYLWPYLPSRYATEPAKSARDAAERYQALEYRRVGQSELGLRAALATGFPVVFGFTVFDSFESDEVARTGAVPMPAPGEAQVGGHAVLLAGYDDLTRRFLVRNSWGASWGEHGYCRMPYEYIAGPGLASDFWAVTKVE